MYNKCYLYLARAHRLASQGSKKLFDFVLYCTAYCDQIKYKVLQKDSVATKPCEVLENISLNR